MMSFALRMSDDKVMKMQSKLEELEKALQRIGTAKKQLSRNTAEAKSRIQSNISRQLEALRNREVWLLNQLDTISGVKEEVLQQQSVRLNKTLGVLQSSIKYPNGDGDATGSIDRMDLGDLQPEETPHVSFKSDPSSLKDAIMNYGRIDANSVTGIQSPFMDPDHQAPSLPRHFEDYNDVEHLVLYKTVEELNRTKTAEPPVPVFSVTPILSSRMEDWLMPATTETRETESARDYRISLPKLSDNLSDWLRSPVCLNKEPSTPIDDLSKDASIQNWLHKIKQCPMEEEEDDYEFIDESETQTQSSGLEQFPDLYGEEETDTWLVKRDAPLDGKQQCLKQQVTELPSSGWLLKSESTSVKIGDRVDMSRYFSKITNELDKWLIKGVMQKQHSTEEKESVRPVQKHTAPSTLDLSKSLWSSHISRVDNPWLLSTPRSNSASPVASCRSSLSCYSTQQKKYSKWLVNGGLSDCPEPKQIVCPIMEKFNQNADSVSWLKTPQYSDRKSENPMACFQKFSADSSLWLKKSVTDIPNEEKGEIPTKKFIEGSNLDTWLLKAYNKSAVTGSPVLSEKFPSKGDHNIWLVGALSTFPQHDEELQEVDL